MGRQLRGWMVAVFWGLTFVLAFVGVGGWISQRVEGIDPAQIPRLLALLTAIGLVASVVATAVWSWRLEWPSAGAGEPKRPGRRRFLIGTGAVLGGVAGTVVASLARPIGWLTVTGRNIVTPAPTGDPNPRSEWQGARIERYRRLGRTGFQVSDVSLGSSRIKGEIGEAVARAAIERGVNYFDTAPDYSEYGSEIALGRAMKGHRDRMFVATKFCTAEGHLQVGSSVRRCMEVVEGSLERLQTDHVDLVHIHSCNSVERLMDPNVHEAFDRLKEQGKARFLGVSTHTPKLAEVTGAAIDSGRFDVLMLAYHHGAWPELGALIDRAAESDVAVVAMKTLKGARHRGLVEFRDQADSYTQAAFKWVLSNPSVACLVISFREMANVDEYLYASGKPFSAPDQQALLRYDELIAGVHCFQHCGACLDACPLSLPIDDVLRYRMYFEDYGDEKEAMRLYSRLQTQADVCIGCSAPCTGACPYSIPIQERTTGAHRMLTLG